MYAMHKFNDGHLKFPLKAAENDNGTQHSSSCLVPDHP
jgi:hypothetical protein